MQPQLTIVLVVHTCTHTHTQLKSSTLGPSSGNVKSDTVTGNKADPVINREKIVINNSKDKYMAK